MTKAIRSYPEGERLMVINRRLRGNVGGLGTLAAKDAARKLGIKVAEKEKRDNKTD